MAVNPPPLRSSVTDRLTLLLSLPILALGILSGLLSFALCHASLAFLVLRLLGRA